MTGYNVVLVPQNQIREAWRYAKPHLQAAVDLSHGRWQSDYVLASLVMGEQNLWIAMSPEGLIDGAVTSQIAKYPEKTMLAIHFLGGNHFDDWYPQLLAVMTRFAKDSGCNGIECLARKGFWKWFQHDGFEITSVFYEKEVT